MMATNCPGRIVAETLWSATVLLKMFAHTCERNDRGDWQRTLAALATSGSPRCDVRSIGLSSGLRFWVQIDAIYLLPAQIVQGDGHHLVFATDFDHRQELQAIAGWADWV